MSNKKWVKSREVIFREGDPGDYMYVVVNGAVQIHKNGSQGPIMLAEMGRGDFFGEMVMLGQQVRTATATATTETDLLVFRSSEFPELLQSRPDMAERMIRSLVTRLKDTTDKLAGRDQ
jgi:CRP-like cAMP-binding protein